MILSILNSIFIISLIIYVLKLKGDLGSLKKKIEHDSVSINLKIESINSNIEKRVESKYSDIREYYENAILSLSKRIEKRERS